MDFELITAPAARKGELEHAFLKLTNEQIGLLDYISEQKSATIQGVAGTGKTLIAKEAARRFGNHTAASIGKRSLRFVVMESIIFL
jgi:MoxR-like ATPase